MSDQLPDGWGPSSPRDDTLVRAYTDAYADLAVDLGTAGGMRTQRTDDWAGMDAHQPFPFLNIAVLRRPLRSVDDPVLDEITAFYEPDDEGTPFMVWSSVPTPDFTARGWMLMGHPPLMLRPAAPVAPSRPDGVEIVRVRDAEMLELFQTTLVEGYPVPEMTGRRFFGEGILDAPGWEMFVALADGEAVGTSAAHVTDAFVDVEWIATRASHRGRGIGEALTWAATLATPDRPAMLFASDLGQPIYERMGYLRLSRLTLWIAGRG